MVESLDVPRISWPDAAEAIRKKRERIRQGGREEGRERDRC
jgi:hypothetical protein